MPRPAIFTLDELLDAAAALLAADGPSAVTMSAVARAAGAPSGSMYHRFDACRLVWRTCGCAQAPDRGAGDPRERGRDRRAMRAGTYTCTC